MSSDPADGEAETVVCAACGRRLPRYAAYVVRIDVFAEPAMPPLETQALGSADFDQTMADLLEQMNGMTPDELQDDVHRRFEFHVCRACQRLVLANPLGTPRHRHAREN